MKILIHSNGPMVPTGYGKQVKLLAPRLQAAGHEVAVSAFYGLSGSPITWQGVRILPASQVPFGIDVVDQHARNHGADMVLTLMDFWRMLPAADRLTDLRVMAWLPVDCDPLSHGDLAALGRSGAEPLAMSHFGQRVLEQAGFQDTPYIPHMVDTEIFKPPADRTALRTELGVDEYFLVGICAANTDAYRKAWAEQFEAFRRLHEHHPEARLMVHTLANHPNGLPLMQMASDFHIAPYVIWSDQYAQAAGMYDDAVLADWFGCLDVLSAASYAEGFGVPMVEAMACGTPVVATDGSAMTEIVKGRGWLVDGDPFWNYVHRSWWARPSTEQIHMGLLSAYEEKRDGTAAERRDQLPAFAARFAADFVVDRYWIPMLADIGEAIAREDAAEAEQEPAA